MVIERISNRTAITLSELMIAMVIIGIIMIGIVSADFAIQKFYKDEAKGTVSGFDAMAMMSHINTAALGAQGSFTPDATNKGIWIDSSISSGGDVDAVGNKTFCIHNFVDATNTWQCYTQLVDAGVNYLFSCKRATKGLCQTTDQKIAKMTSMTASFTHVTNTGGVQSCLFAYTLIVPDTDTTTRTYKTSVTPPTHRL